MILAFLTAPPALTDADTQRPTDRLIEITDLQTLAQIKAEMCRQFSNTYNIRYLLMIMTEKLFEF